MLTFLAHFPSVKWVLPATFLLGSSTNFFIIWSAWRAVTIFLPHSIFHYGDEVLYSMYQRMVLFFFEHCTGTKIVLYGDAKAISAREENTVLICNHQCTMDWMVADMLAVRQGTLGRLRYILKNSLRYFPIYGLYFRMHKCVYVKRSGKYQKSQAETQLEEIQDKNIPFWMIVFPEGTRYSPSNKKIMEKSRDYAKEQGFPELDYVLSPRYKAVQQCLKSLNSKVFYDVTIAYQGSIDENGKRVQAPGLIDFLNGRCKEIHIHMERILTEDIPKDDANLKQWLHDRFMKKDNFLKRFYTVDQKLDDDGVKNTLQLRETVPSFLFFLSMAVPLMISATGRALYLKVSIGASIFSLFWMGITA